MTLTRRELLTAFLGAPLALSLGCKASPARTPPLPPGELVGASMGIGHRLRDGLEVRIGDDAWHRKQVVIVGGGVAGLSAARRLRMAGVDDIVVLELEPVAGGTARYGDSSVAAYPWGAHYVPAPKKENRALVSLLEELNAFEGEDEDGEPVVAEHLACRDPESRVFYKGTWYEGLYLRAGASEDDLAELKRFREEIDHWVEWRDGQGRLAFNIPMELGSHDAEVMALDQISMAEWMDARKFRSQRLRWFVNYACRDDYGMTLEQTSAWAGVFYFASRRIRAGGESRPLITWPEGNGRIVRHLSEPLKERLQLGWAVADIRPKSEGRPLVEVSAVSHDGQTMRGFRADCVVFAAQQFLTRFLIRDYRRNPPPHVNAFSYGSWAVANLHLKDRPQSLGFPPSWDNVLYESPSLGYIAATHQRGSDYGPTVLTYYYPLCDADPSKSRQRLLEVDRDGWAEIALADLQFAHADIRAQTERIDVMRWGHAMIRPTPGFISGKARRQAAQPYRGIHFAHSDLSGLSLFEEAFYRGALAAEQVLEGLGVETSSIL